MTLNDFVNKWNGKYCEVTGSSQAVNQCVDLANAYIRDVLGLPVLEWTNAIDFPSRIGSNYKWIANSATGVPKEGDLVIWNIGKVGHIAVFIEGNTLSFRSFDQNYPVGTPCHIQNHTYANVIGWIHPKGNDMIPANLTQGELYESNGMVFWHIPNPDAANTYIGDWSQRKSLSEIVPPVIKEVVVPDATAVENLKQCNMEVSSLKKEKSDLEDAVENCHQILGMAENERDDALKSLKKCNVELDKYKNPQSGNIDAQWLSGMIKKIKAFFTKK